MNLVAQKDVLLPDSGKWGRFNQAFDQYLLKPFPKITDLESLLRETYSTYWVPYFRLSALRGCVAGLPRDFWNVTVPFMIAQARNLFATFPASIPFLRQQNPERLAFTRAQICCLLCCGFFGLLPPQDDQIGVAMPTFNFGKVLHDEPGKVSCLLAYFWHMSTWSNDEDEWLQTVKFSRQSISIDMINKTIGKKKFWQTCDKPLSHATVEEKGRIEDLDGELHANFSNRFIGGGVLNGGVAQEEVRFCTMPEHLIAMLFCEPMADNEAILIAGAVMFAITSFDNDGHLRFRTAPLPDFYGIEFVSLCFDALPIEEGINQYSPTLVLRELVKCIVAFWGQDGPIVDDIQLAYDTQCRGSWSSRDRGVVSSRGRGGRGERRLSATESIGLTLGDVRGSLAPSRRGTGARRSTLGRRAVATGNWGCGVFRGDPQLKFLIQWLACTVVDRELRYFPYEEPALARLDDIMALLEKLKANELFNLLLAYANSPRSCSLFEFLHPGLRGRRDSPLALHKSHTCACV